MAESKTYKVEIYGMSPVDMSNISLDGCVKVYNGARPYFNTNYHDPFTINGKFTAFISSTGKQVYTNLPVIIEEE